MVVYAVDWVDAFSDRAFGGNGCAVVHDAGALDAETCKRFVRETSLVECTFLEPSDVADIKIRYFIAPSEIPFAGHPTVASVASLLHREKVAEGDLTIETGAGVLPITVRRDGDAIVVRMTQAKPHFGALADPGEIALIYGLAPEDILGTPQVVSTGLGFTIAVISSHDALRRAKLNWELLQAYTAKHGTPDGQMHEPYLVALSGATDAGRTFSRLLLGPPSPPEDPFTGSATGAAAAYLWHHGLIDQPTYVAEQGHWMGRPGAAKVKINGSRETPASVEVEGAGYVLMSGDLRL